jgi:ABC-type sugar transport system ATPase subunit
VGSPLELYHRPRNRFVAGFIGSPNMNFLPGNLQGTEEEGSRIVLPGSNQVLAKARPQTRNATDQGVTVGVRPEHVRLADPDASGQGTRGKVVYAEYLGESSYVQVQLVSGETVLAKEEGTAMAQTGDHVKVQFAPEHMHVFDAADQAFERLMPALAERRPRHTA